MYLGWLVLARGIIACVFISLIAVLLHRLPVWPFTLHGGQHPIESITLALLLGMLTNNKLASSERYKAGIHFCSKYVLYTSIVFLGVKLNLAIMTQLSWEIIVIIVLCILFSYLLTKFFGKYIGVTRHLSTLIAFGTAICGNSAIAAIAPTIRAGKEDIALSIAVINICGTIAIFAFPIAGHFLQISTLHFSIWAGTSIQAVPQVIAAAFAYSPQSGLLATSVKLVRVLFLAPMILMLIKLEKKTPHTQPAAKRLPWYQAIPPFIILFFLVAALSNIHIFPTDGNHNIIPAIKTTLAALSDYLMIIAMAAIGMHVSFHHIVTSGKKPIILAGVSSILLALFSLLVTNIA